MKHSFSLDRKLSARLTLAENSSHLRGSLRSSHGTKSNAGQFNMPVQPCMVKFADLALFVLAALNHVAADCMKDYHHVLGVKRKHFVVCGIRSHVSHVYPLPSK